MTVKLKNQFLFLEIEPEHGGQVSYFKFQDVDIFRPQAHLTTMSALTSGSFAMLPFSNRIKNGAFEFLGRKIQMESNWHGDANAIHGNGWSSSWKIVSKSQSYCELSLENDSKWWPWAFSAKLVYVLDGPCLKMSVEVTNTSADAMPIGVGFHPYFVANENTKLQFNASQAYLPFEAANAEIFDRDSIHKLDFSKSKSVKTKDLIDHNYDGWDGVAFIENCSTGLDVRIHSDTMRHAMVYSPPHEPFVCFEPTTHSAGAFNSCDQLGYGIKIIEPLQTHVASVSIEVSKNL